MSLCAYSPCNPWFSIHSSTNSRSLDPLSVSVMYRSGDGVKIAVDSFGTLLDVAGSESERCEIARCKAADGGREPVISADVKEGSWRDCNGGGIERAIIATEGPRKSIPNQSGNSNYWTSMILFSLYNAPTLPVFHTHH